MRLLEPTAQIWMKIDPYHQRQKCRPMTPVSENIRFMRIFKRHWGLPTTAIFGDLVGYVFENFRDTASNNYMTICYPLSTGKWLQNEWPWMTLNGYFMAKWVFGQHFLNQSVWMSEIVQPRRFCCVLCIARSDQLASLRRHAQLTRCFSAVAELLVWTTHTLDFGDYVTPVEAKGIAKP